MSAEIAPDRTTAHRDGTTRIRGALPVTKRVARNGKVSYTFQIDAGTKPDGSRDPAGATPIRPWPRPDASTPASRPRLRPAHWSAATS
jgi:hypothetical protein